MTRTCPIALLPSRTDSRAAMKPAAVRRLEPPPHATPQATNAFRRARRERRRCSSPTSATDPTSRAPATDRSTPGVLGPLSQSATIQRSYLRRTRRGVSHLTMRPALRSIFAHAFRHLAVAGVPESWWAPISASPRRDAPRSAALSSAGEECASTSDAPCRDELHAFGALPAARTAFPQGPVKDPDSVRSEAPSIDECPLDPPAFLSERRTNLEREPATGLGALPPFNPASDAPSPPRSGEEVARPRPLPCALHARALLATRRSSTSAIETICKHDLRTSKPGDA